MNVFIIISILQLILVSGEFVIINIRNGAIKGSLKTTIPEGNAYYAFRGIRYAEPPRRFEPSVPAKKWTGIYDATEDKSICIQAIRITLKESEDCLYISVYTPKLPGNTNQTLPVMFWVYGGAFIDGSNLYSSYGPDYLLDNGVVVVTINYRLNILGFLSTGDQRVPGNNGIKDVILGLKWVQENIKYFGGDPNQVTIFGQSAGAAMTSYIIQSPLVIGKGYIHRAIIQSGSSLSQWALQSDPEKLYKQVVDASFCGLLQLLGDKAVLNCLKTAPIETIKATTTAVLGLGFIIQFNILNGIPFAPVYEHPGPTAAITDPAYKTLSKDINIPIITGITSEESLFMSNYLPILRPLFVEIDLNTGILVPDDMYAKNSDINRFISPAIRSYYFNDAPVAFSKDSKILQYISDAMFNKPFREYLTLLKNNVPVYCYQFSYSSELSGQYNHYEGLENVGHTGELSFLFRRDINKNVLVNDNDRQIIKRMTRLWTNFAKTGNPTPLRNDVILNNITWPTAWINGTNVNCLDIERSLTIFSNPKEKGYQFWYRLYQAYGHPTDTYR